MVDFLLGVVGEWTADLELTRQRRRKQFMLLSAGGVDENEREHAGFDLATFTPDFDPWRVFFKPDGSNQVEHRRLIGTAFYEFDPGDGITRSKLHQVPQHWNNGSYL